MKQENNSDNQIYLTDSKMLFLVSTSVVMALTEFKFINSK